MQISKFLEPYDLSVYHIYEGFLYLCMIIGDICRRAKRLNLWNRATNAQNAPNTFRLVTVILPSRILSTPCFYCLQNCIHIFVNDIHTSPSAEHLRALLYTQIQRLCCHESPIEVCADKSEMSKGTLKYKYSQIQEF